MKKWFFVTGFLRSGTTLLEKILHSHPQICIGSQPSPFLFYKAKELFFRQRGINDKYLLGNLFREKRYAKKEFIDFLQKVTFTKRQVQRILSEMEGYSGQQAPELFNLHSEVAGGNFFEVYRNIISLLPVIYGKRNSNLIGAKEVFCEEFIPYFISKGVKVLLVLRDPRDIISSIRKTKGEKFVNRNLSDLYIIRKWRKSVAYAITFTSSPNFLFIRYEDVINDRTSCINKICKFLKIENLNEEKLNGELLDQYGICWKGNSSFEEHCGISKNSIGKYKTELGYSEIQFIENTCYPEMTWIGYLLERTMPINSIENKKALCDPSELEEENTRLGLLHENLDKMKKEEWFIFQEAFDALQRKAG